MSLYSVVMFVHVLGLIAVFAGFAIQQRAGARLRIARRGDEAKPWADLLVDTRSMVPWGTLMLLLTGWYLAGGLWRPPWVLAAVIAVIFMAAASGLLVWPGYLAIGRHVSESPGPLSSAAARAVRQPRTWAALSSANGAGLGTLWLMTAKPAAVEATLVVLFGATAGALAGLWLAVKARRVQEQWDTTA
jgi:hypothetical protein